jgi:hypothetical protein
MGVPCGALPFGKAGYLCVTAGRLIGCVGEYRGTPGWRVQWIQVFGDCAAGFSQGGQVAAQDWGAVGQGFGDG